MALKKNGCMSPNCAGEVDYRAAWEEARACEVAMRDKLELNIEANKGLKEQCKTLLANRLDIDSLEAYKEALLFAVGLAKGTYEEIHHLSYLAEVARKLENA